MVPAASATMGPNLLCRGVLAGALMPGFPLRMSSDYRRAAPHRPPAAEDNGAAHRFAGHPVVPRQRLLGPGADARPATARRERGFAVARAGRGTRDAPRRADGRASRASGERGESSPSVRRSTANVRPYQRPTRAAPRRSGSLAIHASAAPRVAGIILSDGAPEASRSDPPTWER